MKPCATTDQGNFVKCTFTKMFSENTLLEKKHTYAENTHIHEDTLSHDHCWHKNGISQHLLNVEVRNFL